MLFLLRIVRSRDMTSFFTLTVKPLRCNVLSNSGLILLNKIEVL